MDDFHCPHCGGVLSTDDIAGTTVKCQYCDSVLPLPEWLEENIETSVLYANNTRYFLLNSEAREKVLKESEPPSFANVNELVYTFGVEILSPTMCLVDSNTSIEETAMGVLVRKDGFKLSKTIRKIFRKN